MGALNTYRDHVVRLTEGMEGFEGFVPFFDEEGLERATYLFLFQDPHKSGVEKSGVVSHTNNDAFARMITELWEGLELDWKTYCSWNSIPWTDCTTTIRD